MTMHPKMESCGVRLDVLPLGNARDRLLDPGDAAVGERPGRAVHLCNAYTLSLASTSSEYRDMLNRGELNLMDGASVVRVARRLGIRSIDNATRPRGTDLFLSTVDAGRASSTRHYLYGSTPDTAAALERTLKGRFEGCQIVGTESPPYRPLTTAEVDELVARLESTEPDIVWVGLGTPRQDWFVDRLASRVPASFVAVGAAFDFIAGTKREAPTWMSRTGTEWVFRFLSEPRRLWRRYLVGNVRFLLGSAGTRSRQLGTEGAAPST